jgi:chorismate dehydratase
VNPSPAHRVGCVSYLNAKPLIHNVESLGVDVDFRVPSGLLDGALRGLHDLTLLPVADFLRHPEELELVPVGCIGCRGSTWTVRVYSRVPLEHIRVVHGDTDSHTSVTLVRIALSRMFGHTVTVVDFDATTPRESLPETVLLIGDKVITHPPDRADYPVELDLGDAWFRLTGLPFVFAAWVKPRGRGLGDLPMRMAALLETNLAGVEALADRYAVTHGWPVALASDYLGRVLRYRFDPETFEGMRRYREWGIADGILPDRESPF